MHQALTQAAKWFDLLNKTLAAIACVLLVLITLAICAEIVTRWLFDFSNIWLIELSEITLLYVTFLGAAWVLGNDGHVTLDVLLNLMSPDGRWKLHIGLSVLGALACFLLLWFGALVMIDQFQNDIREPTIMAPQSFWITSVIPFGFLLMGIQFLRRAVRSALGLTLRVNSG
jgi:TRAP-type C4-dicarboxylate transport system permease small subunit